MGRDINVLDPQWYVDPWDDYRWLRDEAPMYRDAVNQVWAASRYDDIVDIEKHPRAYSSAGGSRPLIVGQPSMIDSDDPLHQSRRRLVARRFTPRAVKSHEDTVREVVARLLDAATAQGGFDVVQDFAAPLPASVIGSQLGFPPELWPKCQEWSEVSMHAAGQYPTDGGEMGYSDESARVALELAVATLELLTARRAEPTDDLVSLWAHAEVEWPDGTVRPYTDDEIIAETFLLLDGGAETTRSVISTMAWELLGNDDQRALLVEHPELLEHAAVEEMIRWVSPLVNMARTVREDHERHGVTLRAGDEVVLLYASANRDERVFTDPEHLDLARDHNLHVAFGFGTHFCLGASLARLEIRVAYEELVRRGVLGSMRLARGAAEPTIVPGSFSRAVDRVLVEL
jgi:cytochrome P450 family 142 subfamily A polypeptide 1